MATNKNETFIWEKYTSIFPVKGVGFFCSAYLLKSGMHMWDHLSSFIFHVHSDLYFVVVKAKAEKTIYLTGIGWDKI